MSIQGLKVIDHTAHLPHEWTNGLADELGWRDHGRKAILTNCIGLNANCLPARLVSRLSAESGISSGRIGLGYIGTVYKPKIRAAIQYK